MSAILIMTEKANAAKDIAEVIGIGNITAVSGGFLHGSDGDDEFIIVHSQGHCLRLKEPGEINPKYEKWDIADLPIEFTDDELKEIDLAAAKRYGAIKAYLQKADFIINAGDAGREGELIQRWILKKSGIKKNVYRLWTSSLTKTAIKEAYNNLIGGNEAEQKMLDDLYDAGVARAIMDKFMGYNYSRLISLTKTDGVTVNYGRCKSPITHAIIKRDEEIADFVKRPYSYISVKLFKENEEEVLKGVIIDEKRKRQEFDTHDDAMKLANSIKGKAEIISVRVENKIENPPKPYDILTLQKKMSEKHGYEADKTLKLCQALYDEYKILSYPRTDSRYLTTDLKTLSKETLLALNFGEFSEFANMAAPFDIPERYFNDGKVTDHHALIPVLPEKTINEIYKELPLEEKNVFDEIARSFISLFLPSCKYQEIEMILDAEGNKIKVLGRHIEEKGFKIINRNKNTDEEKESNDVPIALKEGDLFNIKEAIATDSETKPKKHFTTASLLDYMKIHNIGTGATRDKILKELTEKKGNNASSSVKKEGKYYIATDFGKKMDELIPEKLKSIDFLSRIDTKLKSIENGELKKTDFIQEVQEEFYDIYKEMTVNKEVLLKNTKEKKLSDFDCPFCKKKLEDKGWGYVCQNWKKDGQGCNYSIPKKVAGKTLSDKILKELTQTGRTKDKINGFKSKAGKKFDAFLLYNIDGDKVNIQFDFNRKK